MNLIEFLGKAKIEDLDLPITIAQKLQNHENTNFQKIYASIQTYRAFGKCSLEGLTNDEIATLSQSITRLLVANGLAKPKNSTTHTGGSQSFGQTSGGNRDKLSNGTTPAESTPPVTSGWEKD